MKPVLRVVPTVANARLQAIVRTCECHGVATNQCPSFRTFMRQTMQHARQIDECARRLEGQIPPSYTGDEITLDTHDEGLALLLWAVVCTGALVTGYSLGQLIVQAVMR